MALGENCYSRAMEHETGDNATDSAARPVGPPASRALAQGEGWCVSELTCRLGPRDRPFEERHDQVTIAAVVEGTFQYRTRAGKALLYPGSFLLGNAGACFECGHDFGAGDRCIAFQFAPSLFEEFAAAVAGSHRYRFPTAMLPAVRELAAPVVAVEISARDGGRFAMDELAVELAEIVLATCSGLAGTPAAPSSRDQRRIGNVLHYIEERAEQPLDLADLADVASMSKYHFLRTFRQAVGVTPYQFLLGVRMRRAAMRLCTTPIAVATIAFDAGFGDLSTFHHRFREVYGMSPGRFRVQKCGPGQIAEGRL
ncbi:MAG: helix-turn-helix transcriptional regulator [Dehalococcoidia bacterium]